MKEYSLQEIFDLPEGIEYINADAHLKLRMEFCTIGLNKMINKV